MIGPFPPSKETAISISYNKYISYRSCKNGHAPIRYVGSKRCVQCMKEKAIRLHRRKERKYSCFKGHEPLQERIMAHSEQVTECGCWIWTRSGNRRGYGQIVYRRKHMETHRASWIAFKGDIPSGLHVLHRCNTPSCVNPDHLYLGTYLDNTADRIAAGTQSRPPRNIGEGHGRAKLKEDESRQIKFGSLSASECAQFYNVSMPTVYAIRSGRNWSWLAK